MFHFVYTHQIVRDYDDFLQIKKKTWLLTQLVLFDYSSFAGYDSFEKSLKNSNCKNIRNGISMFNLLVNNSRGSCAPGKTVYICNT